MSVKQMVHNLLGRIRSGSATPPAKYTFASTGDSSALLEKDKSTPMPTRSLHAVSKFKQLYVEAALKLLDDYSGKYDERLNNLLKELEGQGAAQDRNATKAERKSVAALESKLHEMIFNNFRQSETLPRLSMKQVKKLFEFACADVLNSKDWKTVETQFTFKGKDYISRQVPAAEMKAELRAKNNPPATNNGQDIFPKSYNGKGVCCSCDRETEHATNLWMTELQGTDGRAVFRGIRHGINSPYGLKKGSEERKQGAQNRAKEVVAAALYAQPELLAKAQKGEAVTLRLLSTSLVTGGIWQEQGMLEDQMNAWQELSDTRPLVLSLVGKDGEKYDVNINLEVAALNVGVNELALKFKMGQSQADVYNAKALGQLLGDDLTANGALGGWVGEHLAQNPEAKNAGWVRELSRQVKEIWANKAHHQDGGDPYKLSTRLAVLGELIGATPCWNCKSGKDRTGIQGAEIAMLWALYCEGKPVPPYGPLDKESQQLYQQALLNGGHWQIQESNTGAPGNKVMKDLPPGFNLTFDQRVGDREVWKETQGLSPWVKA
nr:inositol phosphate phosphatase SopB [Pseudomonas sp. MWU13-3659]